MRLKFREAKKTKTRLCSPDRPPIIIREKGVERFSLNRNETTCSIRTTIRIGSKTSSRARFLDFISKDIFPPPPTRPPARSRSNPSTGHPGGVPRTLSSVIDRAEIRTVAAAAAVSTGMARAVWRWPSVTARDWCAVTACARVCQTLYPTIIGRAGFLRYRSPAAAAPYPVDARRDRPRISGVPPRQFAFGTLRKTFVHR